MSNITFVGKGHIKFRNFLNNFSKVARKEIGKATGKNLLFTRKAIRNGIRNGDFEKNRPLTILLKDNDLPLVDQSNMIQSVEIRQRDEFSGEAGFLENKESSHGGDLIKVIKVLQEGATIKITPKMRAFLFAQIREKDEKLANSLRTKKSSGFIVIKPRTFVEDALKNKNLEKTIIKNWEDAVKKARDILE